jgi:hypothetical protein
MAEAPLRGDSGVDPRRRREGDARVVEDPAFFRMDLLFFKTASMLGESCGLADWALCGGRKRRSWKVDEGVTPEAGALLVDAEDDEDGRGSELGLDWGKYEDEDEE